MKLFKSVLLFSILYSLGCALLIGGDEDPGKKNIEIKFKNPQTPFEHISVSSADYVWQSNKTGNTIAVNSLCKKTEDLSLDALKDKILAEIDNLKINKTETIDFDERKAQRINASGLADDTPIKILLIILKKNNCTYDLAYIARANQFEKEKSIFESFLQGFHAP